MLLVRIRAYFVLGGGSRMSIHVMGVGATGAALASPPSPSDAARGGGPHSYVIGTCVSWYETETAIP